MKYGSNAVITHLFPRSFEWLPLWPGLLLTEDKQSHTIAFVKDAMILVMMFAKCHLVLCFYHQKIKYVK